VYNKLKRIRHWDCEFLLLYSAIPCSHDDQVKYGKYISKQKQVRGGMVATTQVLQVGLVYCMLHGGCMADCLHLTTTSMVHAPPVVK
jgi:hypothetical protein